jgi:hypothetical protein
VRKTVAVDLDGVLAQYDGWKGLDFIGEPILGAHEFLAELHKFADILIYTVRCTEGMNGPEKAHLLVNRVRDWLDKNGMVYDTIWDGQGKPLYAAIIDDRAVICLPQPGLLDSQLFGYDFAVKHARLLCDAAK